MKDYIERRKENLISLLEKKSKEININLTTEEFFTSFLNDEICKNCLQEDCCCNRYPCVFAPFDFLDITDIEYMKKILDTGLICVSEAKSGFLTLRPIGKREIYDEPRYQNNTCVLYNYKNGCMLEHYYRPTQGLLLKAFEYHRCEAIYSKEDLYNDYLPYQDILRKLYFYQNIEKFKSDKKEEKVRELVKRITTK